MIVLQNSSGGYVGWSIYVLHLELGLKEYDYVG